MVDLSKAYGLLKSAKALFDRGDVAGVAGLAYQAFEAAVIALGKATGEDQGDHLLRRKKAEEILGASRETMRKLWSYRGIDFYGNEKIGGREKKLTLEEIKESVDIVEKMIGQTEALLTEWKQKK